MVSNKGELIDLYTHNLVEAVQQRGSAIRTTPYDGYRVDGSRNDM